MRVTNTELEDEEQLIDEQLPVCYKRYRDVFSKRASDHLPRAGSELIIASSLNLE